MIDASGIITELVDERPGRRAMVVGIAGAVAAGKSALATDVEHALAAEGNTVAVVSTDDFLCPNDVLVQRGILMRKGFPESYDTVALGAFVEDIREGASEVDVPVYSHDTYDILQGERRVIGPVDVVIVEGVNALSALDGQLDLGVYVHADESDLETWYVTRFHRLCAQAGPGSFYCQFAGMTFDQTDAIAHNVWRDVNLVNLREHIAPSRMLAGCVVLKAHNHRVIAVDVRDDGAGFAEGS